MIDSVEIIRFFTSFRITTIPLPTLRHRLGGGEGKGEGVFRNPKSVFGNQGIRGLSWIFSI